MPGLTRPLPSGTDLDDFYNTLLELLPSISDSVILRRVCGRLVEKEARPNLRAHHLQVTTVLLTWIQRLKDNPSPAIDEQGATRDLLNCFLRAAKSSDILMILGWIEDKNLDLEFRGDCVDTVGRFARANSGVRNFLHRLVSDSQLGPVAVWALARRPGNESIRFLEDIAKSSSSNFVRLAAVAALKKLEARGLIKPWKS